LFAGLLAVVVGVNGCAGRLPVLGGLATSAPVPRAALPPGYRQVVFEWTLDDPDLGSTRGDGAARIAPPDSVRLDFFLAGGIGAGAAILIGDSLVVPAMPLVKRLIPPPAMLWAALGRSAFPAVPDTVVRMDGSALRVDLGRPVGWRVTFHGDTIVHLERVVDGRIAEWIERLPGGEVQYHSVAAHRTLILRNIRVLQLSQLDASIWHLFP